MTDRLDPVLHSEGCDAIVRGLAGWFGVAAGVERCARAVRTQAGFVAVDGDEVVGFVTVEPLPLHDWEITWMAVRADRRGGGIGTELVEQLIASLPHDTASLLVKTVSTAMATLAPSTERPERSTSRADSDRSQSSTSGGLRTRAKCWLAGLGKPGPSR
jgi:GNAT superfamily N-acetyltransferase